MTYDEIIAVAAKAVRATDFGLCSNLFCGASCSCSEDIAKNVVSALRTHAEKRGYRLMVPVEATEEMTDAAIEAHVPGELDNITGDPRERLIACLRREYVAALSAAPDPTKEPTP